MKSIAFIDTEVSTEDNKSYDFGAIDNSGKQLHTGVPHEFFSFIENKQCNCVTMSHFLNIKERSVRLLNNSHPS